MRLLLLSLLLLLVACGPSDPTFTAGEMPECNSEFARSQLVKSIHTSPRGQAGLKVIQLDTIKDYTNKEGGPAKQTIESLDVMGRFCNGHAYTSDGEGDVHFHPKWM